MGAADHWDGRYRSVGAARVSWFEERPAMSLELIEFAGVGAAASLVDVGGGAASLVDELLAAGWADVTVVDVSGAALQAARERIGDDPRARWIRHDLLTWHPPRRYDVWHDRAVFQFLTDEADRQRYRDVLAAAVAPSGTVVVGSFAADGPTQCSGLPVARYGEEALIAALGEQLRSIATRRELHITPAGVVQPFTWVVLRHVGDR